MIFDTIIRCFWFTILWISVIAPPSLTYKAAYVKMCDHQLSAIMIIECCCFVKKIGVSRFIVTSFRPFLFRSGMLSYFRRSSGITAFISTYLETAIYLGSFHILITPRTWWMIHQPYKKSWKKPKASLAQASWKWTMSLAAHRM